MPSKTAAKRRPIKPPELGPDVGFDGVNIEPDGTQTTVRYRIHVPEEVGILRMTQFNKECIRIAYGVDLADLIQSHLKQKTLLNETKFYDLVVENNNILHRLGDINADRDPKLWACALFICDTKEDLLKVPTDAERAMKIQHWNNAGIPYAFFIRSLGTFNRTLKALYESTTRSSRPNGEAAAPARTMSA